MLISSLLQYINTQKRLDCKPEQAQKYMNNFSTSKIALRLCQRLIETSSSTSFNKSKELLFLDMALPNSKIMKQEKPSREDDGRLTKTPLILNLSSEFTKLDLNKRLSKKPQPIREEDIIMEEEDITMAVAAA